MYIVHCNCILYIIYISQLAQWARICLAVQELQEMGVWSLGQGRSPGEGNSNPLQYSCSISPMDRLAYAAIRMSAIQLYAYLKFTNNIRNIRRVTLNCKCTFFFLRFFGYEPFLMSLYNMLQYPFCFIFWFRQQNFSSLTRDQTCTPYVESLNHWTTRKVLGSLLFFFPDPPQ